MKRSRSRAQLNERLEHVDLSLGDTAYVELEGSDPDGDTFLLLHGFTTNCYTTYQFGRALVGSVNCHRVLMFDFYGGGRSATPAGVKLTEDVFVEQTRQFLDAMNVSRVTLIGNSMGAVVAGSFAVRYPERTERLGLIDPGGIPISTSDLIKSPSLCAARLLFHLGTNRFISKHTVNLCGLVIKYVLPHIVPHEESEPVEEWIYQLENNHEFLEGVHSALNNFSFYEDQSPMWSKLAEIGIPTHLVWGENDTISPPRSLCHLLPKAECTVIPGLAHSPQYENPSATVEVLKSFLSPSKKQIKRR